jgi:hypothetical protein
MPIGFSNTLLFSNILLKEETLHRRTPDWLQLSKFCERSQYDA